MRKVPGRNPFCSLVSARTIHGPRALVLSVLSSPARRRLIVSLAGSMLLAALPAVQFPSQHAHVVGTPVAATTWLTYLNAWRSNAGLSALTENPTWSSGDYNHAIYMVK